MPRLNRRTIRWAGIIASLCLAITLLMAFRLWSFSYFWIDDFRNIFWVHPETASGMIGHIANPFSAYYRPVGMFAYWILYRAFGLNSFPYHFAAWSLHSINTFLLFLVLRRLLRSPFAAIAGAVPFAFRVTFADMYWSFGTIFELLACCLTLLGIYLYARYRPSWRLMIALTFVYVLAIKSKEMAVTLAAIWILYDILIRNEMRFEIVLPAAAAAWFTYLRVGTMRDLNPLHPYFMDVRVTTLTDGFKQYFDWVFGIELPVWLWFLGAIGLLLVFAFKRERAGVFFLSYLFVTFMPVIFLPNHRWPYFWYIPFIGISGLVGVGAKDILGWVRPRVAFPKLIFVNAALLICWTFLHSTVEFYRSSRTRAHQASLSAAFRSFVDGLQRLESPEPDATLYFTAMPPNFQPDVLNAAVQLTFERPDIHAEFVSQFPPDAKWKLRFSNGKLERENGGRH